MSLKDAFKGIDAVALAGEIETLFPKGGFDAVANGQKVIDTSVLLEGNRPLVIGLGALANAVREQGYTEEQARLIRLGASGFMIGLLRYAELAELPPIE